MNCEWHIIYALDAAEQDDPMGYAMQRRQAARGVSGSEWSLWNTIVNAMKMRELRASEKTLQP